MAKQYTKEEKTAKLKTISDLRREGTPLIQAIKEVNVPVGTYYTWTRERPARKRQKARRVKSSPELVHIPEAVEPDKIIMLLGTPRNIAAVLERFL